MLGPLPDTHANEALLERSRSRHADVTSRLQRRLLAALEGLLRGLQVAALREDEHVLREALREPGRHVYEGLLTVMLRLVFVLHAEDRGLLPSKHVESLGSIRSYEQLQADADAYGIDGMRQRFGAWPRLLSLFRSLHDGRDGSLELGPCRGPLFDPERFPFFEGRASGQSAPWDAAATFQIAPPRISDAVILHVLDKLRTLDGRRIDYRALDEEQLGRMYEDLLGYTVVRREQTLVIRPGEERRRTGSHYTPRSLCGPIVQRTLEPLLAAMRARMQRRDPSAADPRPTSEMLLGLRICDPAMGSGAFLLECCRTLADHVVAAWTREGKLDAVLREADSNCDPVLLARRMVAQRCLYGVDKSPMAVELGKLSLWLLARTPALSFECFDRHLKAGDSLVGLRRAQIDAMDWAAQAQPSARPLGVEQQRAVADVVLSAYFWPDDGALTPSSRLAARRPTNTARRACLRRLQAELRDWSEHDPSRPLPPLLAQRRELVREQLRPLHWSLEFPEVFAGPDPRGMDAVLGNPPFLGGRGISSSLGRSYAEWLTTTHAPGHGNADLSAYFLRQARWLLGEDGTLGLIATNTIGQGDTRATGLQPLVEGGARIYEATQGLSWPRSGADVIVSIVHLAVGEPSLVSPQPTLDGQPVAVIDSRLRPRAERPDAHRLAANAQQSFQGSIVLGKGFVLTPQEREALVARDPSNAQCIRPYIGGEELNASPTQAHTRYVIDFGERSLEASAAWPELLGIIETRVKPARDAQRRASLRTRWWQHADRRPGLYRSIAPLPRCLACSIHAKHSIFSFQPVDRVFSHALVIFPFPSAAAFGLLQSRVHRAWARWQGSSMRHDLRYTPSNCFETFPFPPAPALDVRSPLHASAARLYEARAALMLATDAGLTKTYDALVDPTDSSDAVARLRALHVALDRAVLDAYGHPEIGVPPFAGAPTDAVARFEDEVLDMLLALNETQAAQHR